MNCYLCQLPHFIARKGEDRDIPGMQIVERDNCGLLTLSAADHIATGVYENSIVHDSEPAQMEKWLEETAQEGHRRFEMVKPCCPMSGFWISAAARNSLAAQGWYQTGSQGA